MIPTNPFGIFPQEPITPGGDKLHTTWDRFLRAIYARTGGQSGVPFTIHPAVQGGAAASAPTLSEDFNVVTVGPNVRLANIQPAQTQQVTNATGANLTILPPSSQHTIDNLTPGTGYVLANGKSQRFTKTGNLTSISFQQG